MPEAAAVRRARREDLDPVGRLWLAFLEEQSALDDRFRPAEDALARWQNDFSTWLRDEGRRIFVAEAGGEVVGFITAHRWYPPPIYAGSIEVYIDELYVGPAGRGQGTGAALVGAVRTWADSLPADRLRLSALAENAAARTFWEAQGARPFSVSFTLDLGGDRRKGPPQEKKLGF